MQVLKTDKELRQIRLEDGLKEYLGLFVCASLVVAVFVMVYFAF